MKIELIDHPKEDSWAGVRERAVITVYRNRETYSREVKLPTSEWKKRILGARHSPIRYLRYSFLIEGIPSNTATHLCRHVHAQPYVSSLRNDRQSEFDGDAARRDTPVNMIFDVNAEELMVIANKRLCIKSAERTRAVVKKMCELAIGVTPELKEFLVPMCEYTHFCYEFNSCGRWSEKHEQQEND